jgi:hypothetical protein
MNHNSVTYCLSRNIFRTSEKICHLMLGYRHIQVWDCTRSGKRIPTHFVFKALQFQFITVKSLGETRDPASQRLVRSHALRQSLKAKRKRAEERQENFRFVVPQHPAKSLCQRQVRGAAEELPATIAGDRLDPFDSLAVDSSRLQTFLSNG